MEQTEVVPEQIKRATPWGTIIGIVLILAVIVAGAYYSFTKRYVPAEHAVTVQQ